MSSCPQAGRASFRHTDRLSAYSFCRRTLVQFRLRLARPARQGHGQGLPGQGHGVVEIPGSAAGPAVPGDGPDRVPPRPPANAFKSRFTKTGIGLLAEVDATLGQMCGHATRAVLRRMYEEYGDKRFERLATISNGHFYNLLNSTAYSRRRTAFRKTKARQVGIAERRKPAAADGQSPAFRQLLECHEKPLRNPQRSRQRPDPDFVDCTGSRCFAAGPGAWKVDDLLARNRGAY